MADLVDPFQERGIVSATCLDDEFFAALGGKLSGQLIGRQPDQAGVVIEAVEFSFVEAE